MANAIQFEPKRVDPKQQLLRRLEAAPVEHAEALLVAYELLEEAHKQGILDALHGAIGARDTLLGLISEYAVEEVSVQAIRNLLALGRILGSLDPEPLSKLAKDLQAATSAHTQATEPPSWWQLFKCVRSPETRRGFSLITGILSAVGRAAR